MTSSSLLCRDDFEEDEYEETKAETLEQLKEFDQTLQKMMTGDLGLVDKFAAMQLVRCLHMLLKHHAGFWSYAHYRESKLPLAMHSRHRR